ncbi:bifunctional DNA primase/polymerase [Luedemannella helvata]|uniref:Bifunctional DNA primase/polymerase n=1 Tax=Luedemannella helvata TaxID=349315 RepID=A0ABN2JXC4_9ACTN
MDSLLDAALRYARRGVPVFPLHTPAGPGGCSCANDGCPSPGKHPRVRHGVHDASTEPRAIRAWWRRWPLANIGLATGVVMDVCDLDTEDGLSAVRRLITTTGPTVRSGHGWHLWFAPTGHGNRTGLVPGVDWRGKGGSIVAPPSRHPSGRRYAFARPWDDRPLPSCPPELLRLVAPPARLEPVTTAPLSDPRRYAQAAVDGEVDRVLRAPRPGWKGGRRTPGGRNSALNAAAFRLGQLAAVGELDPATVWTRLTEAALATGLSPQETRRTIESGWRAGLRRPRETAGGGGG